MLLSPQTIRSGVQRAPAWQSAPGWPCPAVRGCCWKARLDQGPRSHTRAGLHRRRGAQNARRGRAPAATAGRGAAAQRNPQRSPRARRSGMTRPGVGRHQGEADQPHGRPPTPGGEASPGCCHLARAEQRPRCPPSACQDPDPLDKQPEARYHQPARPRAAPGPSSAGPRSSAPGAHPDPGPSRPPRTMATSSRSGGRLLGISQVCARPMMNAATEPPCADRGLARRGARRASAAGRAPGRTMPGIQRLGPRGRARTGQSPGGPERRNERAWARALPSRRQNDMLPLCGHARGCAGPHQVNAPVAIRGMRLPIGRRRPRYGPSRTLAHPNAATVSADDQVFRHGADPARPG